MIYAKAYENSKNISPESNREKFFSNEEKYFNQITKNGINKTYLAGFKIFFCQIHKYYKFKQVK